MQHWAFVAPLSNQHVWARDHADSRYYSYLKNSLEHHLSVYGRIWSMGDELGLDRDNKRCFCWYAADLEMTLLEPASAQGHNLGSSARLSADVTPLVRPNRTVLLPAVHDSAIDINKGRQKLVLFGHHCRSGLHMPLRIQTSGTWRSFFIVHQDCEIIGLFCVSPTFSPYP